MILIPFQIFHSFDLMDKMISRVISFFAQGLYFAKATVCFLKKVTKSYT